MIRALGLNVCLLIELPVTESVTSNYTDMKPTAKLALPEEEEEEEEERSFINRF